MRFILFALVACSSAVAQSAKPATIAYYLLDSTIRTANGRQVGSSVSLVKRITQPDKGTIEEHVLSLRGSEPGKELVTILKPDGSKVKISAEGFEGEGTLSGPEWAWSGMQFTVKMPEQKMIVEGKDEFAADRMSAEKRILGADGQPRNLIHEEGPAISAAVYEALHSRLIAK